MSTCFSSLHLMRDAASTTAIAIGLIATAANAQRPAPADAPATSLSGLEDIVVTARRINENLQDVPIAVTAFTGASLQQQNATKISDVARLTPSLTIRESPSNPTAISITLRGQVQTDVLATLDPSVGTMSTGFIGRVPMD